MNFLSLFTKYYFESYKFSLKKLLITISLIGLSIYLIFIRMDLYIFFYLIYNFITSQISLYDNNIFLSNKDMKLFDLKRAKLFSRVFILQRILLNDIVMDIFYFIAISSYLVYLKEYMVIFVYLYVYGLFKLIELIYFERKSSVKESIINIKIILEVSLIAIITVYYLITTNNNIRDFLLINNFLIVPVLLGYYAITYYTFNVFLESRTFNDISNFKPFRFLTKIDIHFYKEFVLFKKYYFLNILNIVLFLSLFLIDSSTLPFNVSWLLLSNVVLSSNIFIYKKNKKYVNLMHDDFFLSKNIKLEDKKKIIKKKLFFSIIVSILVKLLIFIFSSLWINIFDLSYVIMFTLITVLISFAEFNQLLINNKIDKFLFLIIKLLSTLVLTLLVLQGFYAILILIFVMLMLSEYNEFNSYKGSYL